MGKKDKSKEQPSATTAVAKKPLKATSSKNEKEKASTSGRTKRSEIDDIFNQIKASKIQSKEEGDKAQASKEDGGKSAASKSKKGKAVSGSKDDLFGKEEDKSRKRTEEGYRIFTEEELGLNKKGGDTDLCPFDCDCCF